MEETKGLTIPTVGHATKELETVMDGQTPTAMATPPHPEVPAPLNAYLSKAKFYFKASKFEEALKECRKAIVDGVKGAELYEVLHTQCNSQMKLERWKQAIEVASEMMRLSPRNFIGYMRGIHILESMDRKEKAFKCYCAAKRKLTFEKDASEEEKMAIRRGLKILYDRTHALRMIFVKVDPLRVFPQELAVEVFKHFTQKDILNCVVVAPHWRDFTASHGPFWEHPVFGVSFGSVRDFRDWVEISEKPGKGIQSFTYEWFDGTAPLRQLEYATTRLRKLEAINLDGHVEFAPIRQLCSNMASISGLKSLKLGEATFIVMEDAITILQNCPALEVFHACHVGKCLDTTAIAQWDSVHLPNLVELKLGGKWAPYHGRYPPVERQGEPVLSQLNLADLITKTPSMQHAEFSGFRITGNDTVPCPALNFKRWRHLTHLSLVDTRITNVPTFPKTLRYLNVEGVCSLDLTLIEQARDTFHLPNLVELRIQDSDFIVILNELANPPLKSGTLKVLNIGRQGVVLGHRLVMQDWPDNMLAPSETLEVLSLRDQPDLDEDVLIAFLKRYPNLTDVDLSLTSITGITIKELYTRAVPPEYIAAEYCRHLYHDAVEIARSMGIDVLYEMHNSLKRRKRNAHGGSRIHAY